MDTHKSMSGSVCYLGDGLIEWGASMQKRIALATSAAGATAMYYTAVLQAEVNALSFREIRLNEISREQDRHWVLFYGLESRTSL